MKFSIAVGAALIALACAPLAPAAAMPFTPQTSAVARTGDDTIVVRYGGRGNHYGWNRGRGRGQNYGWSRGRHRGWR